MVVVVVVIVVAAVDVFIKSPVCPTSPDSGLIQECTNFTKI